MPFVPPRVQVPNAPIRERIGKMIMTMVRKEKRYHGAGVWPVR